MTEPERAQPAQTDAGVLAYATTDDNGLPDCHPEADAIVQNGGSPRAIVKFFPSARLAAVYFVKSFERSFAKTDDTMPCAVCGRPFYLYVVVTWRVAIPFPLVGIRLSVGQDKLLATTWHPVCTDCFTTWDRWLAGARWCSRLLQVVVVIFVLSIAVFVYLSIAQNDANVYFGMISIACLIGVSLIGSLHFWFKRLAAPRPIKRLRRRGLQLIG